MTKSKSSLIFALLFYVCIAYSQGQPFDQSNPKSQVEYISSGAVRNGDPKPIFLPVTQKPLVINTPPPNTDPNTKTFSYNAQSKTWTLIIKGDPQPDEDTLLWNQSNDKWLTKTPQ